MEVDVESVESRRQKSSSEGVRVIARFRPSNVRICIENIWKFLCKYRRICGRRVGSPTRLPHIRCAIQLSARSSVISNTIYIET
jgi:hypothetical protein